MEDDHSPEEEGGSQEDHDVGVADHGQKEWDREQEHEYGVVVVVVRNTLAGFDFDFDFDTLDTGPVDIVVVVQNQHLNTEELGSAFAYSASSKAYLAGRLVAEAEADDGTVAGMAGWTAVASFQVGLVVAAV